MLHGALKELFQVCDSSQKEFWFPSPVNISADLLSWNSWKEKISW